MKNNEFKILLEQVDAAVEKPFVTAKFGSLWREHQRRMLDEGQIDIDMILNIAWKQGRRALILEDVLKQYYN